MTVFGGRPKYSSGMGQRPRNGKPFGGPSWPIRLGQISISDVLWGKIWEKTENKITLLREMYFFIETQNPWS